MDVGFVEAPTNSADTFVILVPRRDGCVSQEVLSQLGLPSVAARAITQAKMSVPIEVLSSPEQTQRTILYVVSVSEMPDTFEYLGYIIAQELCANTQVDIDVRLMEDASSDSALSIILGLGFGLVLGADGRRSRGADNTKNTVEFITAHAGVAALQWPATEALACGTKLAQDLVDAPPNHLTPALFEQRCLSLSALGVKVKVLDEQALQAEGLECLLAVGRGSVEPSSLVIMEWNGGKDGKPLALVGKGVCFDAGGLSLKSVDGMMTMKSDMAGAAATVGAISAIARQKLPVNVVGIVALAENMPSGDAIRPGDVIRAHDGRSIEVLNTDYEGRLVLADALSFTTKTFSPTLVASIGTLTGGVVMALGDSYAGLFTNSDRLADIAIAAGKRSGEEVWRLPVDSTFDTDIKSDFADVRNIGRRRGAPASVCARFLQGFADPTPWLHLDIAGVALTYRDHHLGEYSTGFGVRFFVSLVNDYVQEIDVS